MRASLGGQAAAEALIQAAVDNANAAFANSAMDITYRLVNAAEVNYSESTGIDALYWLEANQAVTNMRAQYSADMVSIIVDVNDVCGVGYVQDVPGPEFSPYAFQATAVNCAVSNLSFAHEHGHNLGMEHNPENGSDPSEASYPWSFGHYVDGVFRTVMSYSNPCSNGCPRIARHANPDITYNGYETGIDNTRENARTGLLVAPIVSRYY